MASEPIEVRYTDDPNPTLAGMGLMYAPFVSEKLGGIVSKEWMMSPSEQMGMVYLLEALRPRVAIEVGTKMGGSLQVVSRFSEKVYSLDIDPEVPRRLEGKHANVEYVIGDSRLLLPELVEKLQQESAQLSFVLIDGDHSAEGVKADVENILKFRPTVPLYVVMHDSANPTCRRGLMEARWADSPYVHAVELDFVMGTVNPSPACKGEVWGGLSLAMLRPEKRQGRFEVTGRGALTVARLSAGQNSRGILQRIRRRLVSR